jgi:hypothetical protein
MNINSISSANPISFKQTLTSSAANQIKEETGKTVKQIVQEAKRNIKHFDAEECINGCFNPNTDECTEYAVPKLVEIAKERSDLKPAIINFFTDLFNSQEIKEDPASPVLLKTFKNALNILA